MGRGHPPHCVAMCLDSIQSTAGLYNPLRTSYWAKTKPKESVNFQRYHVVKAQRHQKT